MIFLAAWRRSRVRRLARSRTPAADAVRLAALLAALLALHTGAMTWTEGLALADAAWLTATTVTTVGYGDLSPATAWGRAATAVLLYGGGIFVLARAAGDYLEHRAERRERMRRGAWGWKMDEHLLVAGLPATRPERFVMRLAEEIGAARWGRGRAIAVVTTAWPDGLPGDVARAGVAHVHGSPADPAALARAAAANAAAALVMVEDPDDPNADAVAFDRVDRVRGLAPGARIVADCASEEARPRLLRAGADAVVRGARSSPALAARAITHPGSAAVLAELASDAGARCVRVDATFGPVRWRDVVTALLDAGAGTAIGYATAAGTNALNPAADEQVEGLAVFLVETNGRAADLDATAAQLGELGDHAPSS